MKILAVVTPPYVYHGWSTRKTFWEEIFTPVNMKNCGRRNARKHREINNGDKYITLYIYLNSDSLEKIKITPSEPKDHERVWLPIWVARPLEGQRKLKRQRISITNVSHRYISKIVT